MNARQRRRALREDLANQIPDLPILQFLKDLDGRWANWFVFDSFEGPSPSNSVVRAMPEKEQTERQIVFIKMKSLAKKGLIEGCFCGCRGDFVITDAGRQYLAAVNERSELNSACTEPAAKSKSQGRL